MTFSEPELEYVLVATNTPIPEEYYNKHGDVFVHPTIVSKRPANAARKIANLFGVGPGSVFCILIANYQKNYLYQVKVTSRDSSFQTSKGSVQFRKDTNVFAMDLKDAAKLKYEAIPVTLIDPAKKND